MLCSEFKRRQKLALKEKEQGEKKVGSACRCQCRRHRSGRSALSKLPVMHLPSKPTICMAAAAMHGRLAGQAGSGRRRSRCSQGSQGGGARCPGG